MFVLREDVPNALRRDLAFLSLASSQSPRGRKSRVYHIKPCRVDRTCSLLRFDISKQVIVGSFYEKADRLTMHALWWVEVVCPLVECATRCRTT